MTDYFAREATRHAQETSFGLHDDACEWRNDYHLCHCAKRRREARGLVTLPTEDLWIPPPDCMICGDELDCDDDDRWSCPDCHVSWAMSGLASTAKFTDDYGDLTPKGGR